MQSCGIVMIRGGVCSLDGEDENGDDDEYDDDKT